MTATAAATVKMPRVHFHRTFSALKETNDMIQKLHDEKLLASYKLHASALESLLAVVEIVDDYTGAEAIEMANAVHVFLKEFKANAA